MYDFLGRYICKIYTDDLIVRLLKRSVGDSYLDIIGPGDIVDVIALVKNGKEVWDQDLRYSAVGAAAMVTKEPKLKPKFTGGKGQKRIRGKSLWNKEGMTFFQTEEKNWSRVYDDRKVMRVLYREWDEWLKEYGKKLIIGDGSNKTFHLVMATWDKDEADDSKVAARGKSGDSSGNEERNSGIGYNSDKGARKHGTWKDIKSGQYGGKLGNNSDEESHDGVEEDKESEGVRKETEHEGGRSKRIANERGIKHSSKSKKNKKTGERNSVCATTKQWTPPKKNSAQGPKSSTKGLESPLRRSTRPTK